MHLSLQALAPAFPHVLFARIRASDVMAGYADAGLPALMVYRGGHCVANALRIGDALPRAFSDADLVRLLQSQGVLSVPQGQDWQQQQQQRRQEQRSTTRPFALSKVTADSDEDD